MYWNQFRYGFSSIQNIDNFINEPDNFHLSMLWPNLNGTNDALQGGYHYMKLEGKYIDQNSEVVFITIIQGPQTLMIFHFCLILTLLVPQVLFLLI